MKHYAIIPFLPICEANEPNQETTEMVENVDCPQCLAMIHSDEDQFPDRISHDVRPGRGNVIEKDGIQVPAFESMAPPPVSYGMLSGPEIINQVFLGNIRIEPFDESMVGPNSLDVRLGPELIELDSNEIDHGSEWDLTEAISANYVRRYRIMSDGFVLKKGVAYLGHTIESIWCRNFVPWLDTRSTVGRYFLQCHMTAGRGDCQWQGTFTMEMMALARSVRVYTSLPIAQISFFSMMGTIRPYEGSYSGQTGPRLPNPLKLAGTRGHDHKE